jgi:gliding motility-associated-like protein
MNKLFAAIGFVLFSFFSNAQNIGGVINIYTKVQTINYCSNTVTVADASAYNVGDKVLMIQMQGGNISTNDDPLYGLMLLYNGAGNYEVQKIKSKIGNTITFEFNIDRFYDANGALQLVSIPQYTTATITTPLTCKKWDGNTGGVLILEADSLNLNDSITVSDKGFKGGMLYNETSCYNNGTGGATTYRCASGGNCGATKGEGATNLPYALGRGANANGGGGGDDHNTGGGGGSNYGKGGKGGQRLNVSNTSCPGPAPGEGGIPFPYSSTTNRLFMGGGGGAGDQNNNEGTAGKDGGGIIILNVSHIVSNGKRICANGTSLNLDAQSDGAGGAGAGGTVFIHASSINGPLRVEAKGGNGGSVDNGGSFSFCFGPGGGGAGGALLVNNASLLSAINWVATGGLSGAQTFGSNPPACPLGSVNGAEAGQDGGTATGFSVYTSSIPFAPIQLTALTADKNVCAGEQLLLEADASASHALSFTWDNGVIGKPNNITALNTKSYTVTIADTNNCKITAMVIITVNVVQPFIIAVPDSAIIEGQTVQLSTNTPGYTYQWSPATTLNSASIYNPLAKPERTTTYCVTITDAINCSGSVCKTIDMIIPEIRIPTAFTPNGDGNNDVFRAIEAPKTSVVEIKIYNRWGELIFQSDNNTGWDGKWKGALQPTESYVCKVGYTSVLAPDKVVYKMQSFSLLK